MGLPSFLAFKVAAFDDAKAILPDLARGSQDPGALLPKEMNTMPLQEYLASYAVRVDEDGARRLQRILEQNRESAGGLAEAFSSARSALATLKAELSDTSGIRSSLASLSVGSLSSTGGEQSARGSGDAGSGSPLSLSGGAASVAVSADMSGAEKSLDSYKSRAEALQPKLNVNTSGITSSVSSAIASVRSMMSSFSLTIPVKVRASLDTSGLPLGSAGSSGSGESSSASRRRAGVTITEFGYGGRVSRPTLAMIAEEGDPEYVIPVKNEARALSLLRSLMGELSASARAALAGVSAPGPARTSALAPASVQAPVNIYVTSSAAPEAVGQSIYDTARRSLLKTLEGVFA